MEAIKDGKTRQTSLLITSLSRNKESIEIVDIHDFSVYDAIIVY